MNACEEFRELLSAHVDGELTVDETRRLEVHLAECEACRRELSEMRRIWEGLGVLENIQPRADLAERVFTRVLTTRPVTSSGIWSRRWLYPAAAAAVLLVSLVVGTMLQDRAARRQTPIEMVEETPENGETEQIVRNMELLENLDLLREFDALAEMGDGVLALPEDGATNGVNGPNGGES